MRNRHLLPVAFLILASTASGGPAAVPDFGLDGLELSLFDRDSGETRPMPDSGFNKFGDIVVKVRATGPAGAFAPGRKLVFELVPSAPKQPAQSQDLQGIGQNGATFALAIFRVGVICGPMTIRARIDGQKKSVVREVKLDHFQCGE